MPTKGIVGIDSTGFTFYIPILSPTTTTCCFNEITMSYSFTAETARAKVQAAEDAWNTKDPARVSLAYTLETEWRNRDEFVRGRDGVIAFLSRKWANELDYRLRKELWAFTDNRIAVRFEYEWHNHAGQWYRSYGNEMWAFAGDGLMAQRFASINDVAIREDERRLGSV